jgi:hypothetical protein
MFICLFLKEIISLSELLVLYNLIYILFVARLMGYRISKTGTMYPGGTSDYRRKAGEPSEDFATYIQQRGYDLHDSTYGKFASMFVVKFA